MFYIIALSTLFINKHFRLIVYCVKTSVEMMDSSSGAQGVEIPEYLKKNLKVLLDNLPAPNVSKEEFYNRYKVK